MTCRRRPGYQHRAEAKNGRIDRSSRFGRVMGEHWLSAADERFVPARADLEREQIPDIPAELVRAQLERLLSPQVAGIEIAEVGHLEARRGNHAAGAPYAIVRAANSATAALACYALGAVAGVSIEHWLYGWSSVPGDLALTISIYPEIAALRRQPR
jgi:hypothetical protein